MHICTIGDYILHLEPNKEMSQAISKCSPELSKAELCCSPAVGDLVPVLSPPVSRPRAWLVWPPPHLTFVRLLSTHRWWWEGQLGLAPHYQPKYGFANVYFAEYFHNVIAVSHIYSTTNSLQ